MKLNRTCIYVKDIQKITGKSESSGRRLLTKIRKKYGKNDHHFVTIEEFSRYTGIAVEIIQEYIGR